MKKLFCSLTLSCGLVLGTNSAQAASGADIAIGIFGGVILGSILSQPRGPAIYSPSPPPPVYYPYPPQVIYNPPPMPCYNRPVPVYDYWGRHIGWQEIRVCQ